MESKVYNQKGKESGSIKLPEKIFGLKWNSDLVHQVVTSMRSSARSAIAHTKMRGDVRGGGKKPWQQKGTGRARHGSIRSPLWRGGGVTHGPRSDKNFDRKVNKKMKNKALFTILSRKFKDGEVLFIDSLSFPAPKTKEAKEVLVAIGKIEGYEAFSKKKVNTACIALSKKDSTTEKSFSNFSNIEISEARNINPLTLVNSKYIVIVDPEVSLGAIARTSEVKEVKEEAPKEPKPEKVAKAKAKAKVKPAKK
ncbi:50S ribosomal protein L4 [Candidatus Parcubacteria bacterium]|nr:50S ribosomal protein L4 [Candidatus Parcubacteria bacterium]